MVPYTSVETELVHRAGTDPKAKARVLAAIYLERLNRWQEELHRNKTRMDDLWDQGFRPRDRVFQTVHDAYEEAYEHIQRFNSARLAMLRILDEDEDEDGVA
jgi:hypothetical protein